jgi:hypothetical protein
MVSGMRMSSLNRKLLRDLLEMKGQALAIAMVVAAGVAMFVMYFSNFDSLRLTQRAYYERQRFADVFGSLKRANLHFTHTVGLGELADVEHRGGRVEGCITEHRHPVVHTRGQGPDAGFPAVCSTVGGQ